MKEKIVAAVDLGTTKICVIVGRKNEFGKLEILGMSNAKSHGIVHGVILNLEKTVLAIKKAVAEAGKQAKVEIRGVHIGISGGHIKSGIYPGIIVREDKQKEISRKDLQKLEDRMHGKTFPDNQILHVMPQEYSVDDEGGFKDPVGMIGVKVETHFHIITAQIDAVKNINKCVERAGLEIHGDILLSPLASSLSVLSEEEREAGVCLIDIGGGTTDLVIFQDNIIRHTAVIPFGGNEITSDIQQGCVVMKSQAELLKTQHGEVVAGDIGLDKVISIPGIGGRNRKEISVDNLIKIIGARAEDIIERVHLEIINSGYIKKMPAGIVVTGGEAQLTSLKSLFEYMTGLDTRIGYPNEHLGKSTVEEIKNPKYATGVGLVLSGFKSTEAYSVTEPTRRGAKGFDWLNKALDMAKGFLHDNHKDDDPEK